MSNIQEIIDSYNFEEDSVFNPSNNESNENAPDSNNNYRARIGQSSTVTITNAKYVYSKKDNIVTLYCDRIQNDSNWISGELEIICWISPKPYRYGDSFKGDNYAQIGCHVLGHLSPKYGYNNTVSNFQLTKELTEKWSNWQFVFTINEYFQDRNWYIIQYTNSKLISKYNRTAKGKALNENEESELNDAIEERDKYILLSILWLLGAIGCFMYCTHVGPYHEEEDSFLWIAYTAKKWHFTWFLFGIGSIVCIIQFIMNFAQFNDARNEVNNLKS